MPTLQGKVILLIDDQREARVLFRKVLVSDGATILEADSVAEGMKLAKCHVPQMIITDLMMPGETGFDLLTQVRKVPELQRVPVLVLSGKKDRESIFRAISMGATDYIIKPCRSMTLMQKVRKGFRNSSFQCVSFESGDRPQVTVSLAADIAMVSEAGLIVESSAKIGTECEVRVSSNFLEEIGLADAMTRTTPRASRFTAPGRYLSELNLVGISSQAVEGLRKLLRGWG